MSIEEYEREAYELGAEHARNAASWAADGNTSQEHIRRVLAMLEEGDPAAWDFLPREPNLSGEYADDLTPRRLVEDELGVDPDSLVEYLVDAIADAYGLGVSETFEDACVSELKRWLS